MMQYSNLAGTLLSAAILFNSAGAGHGANVPQPASQANVQPASTGAGLIDDGDPGWIWSGMTEYDDPSLQGGTGHAGGPGSYGAYTFHGTGVQIFGFATSGLTVDGRVHKVGRAQISIDGKQIASVSMTKSEDSYGFNIATITGMADTNHVLQIEPTGGWIVVDYIRVLNAGASTDSPDRPNATQASEKSEPQSTPFAGAVIPDGVYRIVLKMDSSKVLSTHDATSMDDSMVEIDGLSNDHQQAWQIASLGGGRYRLSPQNAPDESLTVMSTKLKDTGYAIGTWHDAGLAVSQWYIVPADNGYYRFVSAASTKQVIDLLWNNTNDGSGLILYDWHGGDNQQWALVPEKQ